ncbi:unnamed protein product [Schistosoma margrebowiei]|uniref:Uncharacterized protein n=1 Tax=Schistosoma margrebowiei TaxID=48269 RepID=A0A3P8FUB3_9TREM|nr:unnamed protein product [Schistosoma margrebowiei]
MRELVLPAGFDLVSPSFTVRDVTTGSDSSILFGVFPSNASRYSMVV